MDKPNDPIDLLEQLRSQNDSRKCRLFTTACCRRIWDLLSDELRSAVMIAEGVANGTVSDDTRSATYREVELQCIYVDGDSTAVERRDGFAAEGVLCTLFGDNDYPRVSTYATTCAIAASAAIIEVICAKAELDGETEESREERVRRERSWQCELIRQLFASCEQ